VELSSVQKYNSNEATTIETLIILINCVSNLHDWLTGLCRTQKEMIGGMFMLLFFIQCNEIRQWPVTVKHQAWQKTTEKYHEGE